MENHPASTSGITTPCWAINQTVCITSNLSSSTKGYGNGVIPNPPNLSANALGFPAAGADVSFDVYSEYDLISFDSSSPSEYRGPTAYLYLSVTDVLWNGIAWYATYDDTVWHANAGADWAPRIFVNVNVKLTNMVYAPIQNELPPSSCSNNVTWGDPGLYQCSLSAHYLYTLTITGMSQGVGGRQPAPNFPTGAAVYWNASMGYPTGGGYAVYSTSQRFGGAGCSPSCGNFFYVVKGGWYWSSATCYTGFPCYPNTPSPSSTNCNNSFNQSQSAAAFRCDLNDPMNPAGQPTIGDDLVITLQTNNWDTVTGAEIAGASLQISAYYPNGTFWRNWEAGFDTFPTHHFPATNATATIPSVFFDHAYAYVQGYITAYDQAGDAIQSQNYTWVVSDNGGFQGNFSQSINVTTSPPVVGYESWNGTINNSIPSLTIGSTLNISITSLNVTTGIETALIYLEISYPWAGYTQAVVTSMQPITLTRYYFIIPSLAAGSNVSFFIKAWDINQTAVTSHLYNFFIQNLPTTGPGDTGFFYVEVYDDATQQYVTGANVTITGQAGIINIKTQTSAGLAYPNATGQHFTPVFLPADTAYTIMVEWSGFQVVGTLSGVNSLAISIYLKHYMNDTKTLQLGPNYVIREKKDIIEFELNVPPPPPTFSEPVKPTGEFFLDAVGLAIASALVFPVYWLWSALRKKAEAEEKRITL